MFVALQKKSAFSSVDGDGSKDWFQRSDGKVIGLKSGGYFSRLILNTNACLHLPALYQ
jgi:hypothetical protein